MPSVDDLGQSNYLKKGDVDPAVAVTIAGYENVNVAKASEKPEMRWVLKFNEFDKPLVLNKINGERIRVATGSKNFDDWIGTTIELYHDPMIEFGGKIVGGIRARPYQAGAAGTPPQAPAEDNSIPF